VAAAVAVLRPAWMVVALLAIPYQLEDFVPPRRRGPDRLISNRNPGNIATSTNPLQIDGDSIYGQFFAGLIDDVRVYSTALNASQIAADMNSTLTIGPHNVVVTFTQTQQ
jgi:hypothetical protein